MYPSPMPYCLPPLLSMGCPIMHYYSQYVQYCLFTSQDVSLPVLKFSVKEKEDAFA